MSYKRYNLKGGTVTKDVFVYLDDDQVVNWGYFFTGTLTPDTGGTVDRLVQVDAHTYNEGPGGLLATRHSRAAHSRRYWTMPGFKGSAKPGQTIKVGELDPLNADQFRELREFSYQGAMIDLLNYAKNKAKFEVVIYSPRGKGYVIPGTAPTGQTLNANP
jgi:hypothetical protein